MKAKTTKPLLVLVSGPTGAGKNAIVEQLLKKNRRLRQVPSVTTRPRGMRRYAPNEYKFLDARHFDRLRDAGKFVETARVHGYWYGTLASDLAKPAQAGKIAIKVIDVKGFTKLRRLERYRICSIFVTAESLEELRRRVIAREPTISAERVRARLKTARQELKRAGEYGAIFINRRGQLARTVAQVDRWIDSCARAG